MLAKYYMPNLEKKFFESFSGMMECNPIKYTTSMEKSHITSGGSLGAKNVI